MAGTTSFAGSLLREDTAGCVVCAAPSGPLVETDDGEGFSFDCVLTMGDFGVGGCDVELPMEGWGLFLLRASCCFCSSVALSCEKLD